MDSREKLKRRMLALLETSVGGLILASSALAPDAAEASPSKPSGGPIEVKGRVADVRSRYGDVLGNASSPASDGEGRLLSWYNWHNGGRGWGNYHPGWGNGGWRNGGWPNWHNWHNF